MKKLLATLLCLTILSVFALPAGAQTRRSYQRVQQSRIYTYNGYDNRTFWQKHRDKLTTAGGVLGGAIFGSLIGGHKGAAIGAIAGGGGSALYTYKIRKNRYPYRY